MYILIGMYFVTKLFHVSTGRNVITIGMKWWILPYIKMLMHLTQFRPTKSTLNHNLVLFQSFWKCRLQNGGHVIQASVCYLFDAYNGCSADTVIYVIEPDSSTHQWCDVIYTYSIYCQLIWYISLSDGKLICICETQEVKVRQLWKNNEIIVSVFEHMNTRVQLSHGMTSEISFVY